MPAADSPLWPILRVVVRAAVLFCGLYMFYDRLDPRDFKTLFLCVLTDSGLTTVSTVMKKA